MRTPGARPDARGMSTRVSTPLPDDVPRPPAAPELGTFDRAKPIAVALLLVLGAIAGTLLLIRLTNVLLLLFVAVLFAAALSRPAAALEKRGMPRGAAVALVQALGLGLVVGLLWLVVPPLVEQLAAFADRLPSYVHRVHQLRARY